MPNLTLLIVSGGEDAAELARHAKDMSCYVVISDGDTQAPAFAQADSCLLADANKPEDTAAAAERFSRKIRKIDGVISIGAPVAVTVAAIAERLRLRSVSRETASLAGDRLAVRQRLLAAGVPIPWFSPVETPQALQRIAIERGPHLILKPCDGYDTRGVQQITEAKDMDSALTLARQHSPTQRVIVEEYLQGRQLTAHTLMEDGRCSALWMTEEGQEGLDDPSFRGSARLADVTASAAAAIGLADGPFTIKLVLRDNDVYVVDLAVQLCGKLTNVSGISLMRRAISWALGAATI